MIFFIGDACAVARVYLMGCRCGSEVIPVKGKPKVPNSCPSCGQTCPECRYDLCPSNYKVHF